MNEVFGIDPMWALLIVLTLILVYTDRAFKRQTKNAFYSALIGALLLTIFSDRLVLSTICGDNADEVLHIVNAILRPFVAFCLIFVFSEPIKKTVCFFGALMLIDVGYVCLCYGSSPVIVLPDAMPRFIVPAGIFIISYTTFMLYQLRYGKKHEKVSFALPLILFLMTAISVVLDALGNEKIMNSSICLQACLIYYVLVMNTYKKDALTGLFIRHNLNFELEDLKNKKYDVTLIDVDNFKLINDKYGHDKGDEALVTIVNAVKRRLVKGCRMYRFGGDEFVVISRNVSRERLTKIFEDTNDFLEGSYYHISYGIETHEPGEDGNETIVKADKLMYENKRNLKSESIWDDMTGLYNYRGFLDELETFRKTTADIDHNICLIGIDVEHLSNVNMAFGYTEGNVVIAALARVIKTCLRDRDFIGHLGSDEFGVAIEITDEDDPYISEFIKNVAETMDSAYELAGKDYSVSLNFAKLIVEKDNSTPGDELLNNVLYIKQEEKENRRKTDISSNDDSYNSEEENEVMDIINNNKLRYAFQPIVSAKDGHIVGYESLMRSDADRKISPLKILKYATKNDRLYDIEKLTFNNVLKFASTPGAIPLGRRLFINSIPGFNLNEDDFAVICNKYSSIFGRIVVEITEQREIEEEDLVMINTCRDKYGFNLALDDYGSGCSNTNSILRYTPEIIKLDRLLITGIDKNTKKQFFVNSIITFARENDILVLAEGVETENELKTVIHLGVDFIQGYVTAKPSFDVVDEIDPEIQKMIISENVKARKGGLKVYTAASNIDLSLVHLAMEDYTRINVSAEYVTITGSTEYTADMCIRIKAGCNCNLRLVDVRLSSVDDLPCIEIEDGAKLTLVVEGQCSLNSKGIHVPENSSFEIKGTGNIDIYVKGHSCYGIGAGDTETFGEIIARHSGRLLVNTDGEQCVGIGGGICTESSRISIQSGITDIVVAGVNAVGIGCFEGDVPIEISECRVSCNFRVNEGTAIGSINGNQNILIRNFDFKIEGSGSQLSAIGTLNKSGGKIVIASGVISVKMSGHEVGLIAVGGGDVDIELSHAKVDLLGEGDKVIVFGSYDYESGIRIYECTTDIVVNAATPVAYGVMDDRRLVEGPGVNVVVNGDVVENRVSK